MRRLPGVQNAGIGLMELGIGDLNLGQETFHCNGDWYEWR